MVDLLAIFPVTWQQCIIVESQWSRVLYATYAYHDTLAVSGPAEKQCVVASEGDDLDVIITEVQVDTRITRSAHSLSAIPGHLKSYRVDESKCHPIPVPGHSEGGRQHATGFV